MKTIEQHVQSARHSKDGMAVFVRSLQTQPALVQEAKRRLVQYAEMDRSNRLQGCWISKTIKETLTAALAVVNQQPGAPAAGA